MQIQLFTIPITDNGSLLAEMNRFLRGHKIVEVQNEFHGNDHGACWCFCVKYIEPGYTQMAGGKRKVDYKQVLDEETFRKFSRLRETRKKIAAEQGIPAFAVFTDEELAGLARLPVITRKNMLSIKGIGDKKVERFAEFFVENKQEDEKTGKPD